MSEGDDTFWASLAEKFFGVIILIIGAILLYFTATTSALGTFSLFFGIVSVILIAIGLFLLLVRPTE